MCLPLPLFPLKTLEPRPLKLVKGRGGVGEKEEEEGLVNSGREIAKLVVMVVAELSSFLYLSSRSS